MDLQNIIYEKCLNVNMEFADDIDGLVDNILKTQRKEHMNQINKMQLNINTMQNDLDNYKQKLIDEQIRSDNQRNIRRSLPIIRQFMNSEFRLLWDNLSLDIKQKYDNTIDTSFIKRQQILTDVGVKYALLILNDKHVGISKKTCKYYLDLNDTYHPNIKPEHKIVHNCIIELKKITSEIPIDIDILNELDKLCLAQN